MNCLITGRERRHRQKINNGNCTNIEHFSLVCTVAVAAHVIAFFFGLFVCLGKDCQVQSRWNMLESITQNISHIQFFFLCFSFSFLFEWLTESMSCAWNNTRWAEAKLQGARGRLIVVFSHWRHKRWGAAKRNSRWLVLWGLCLLPDWSGLHCCDGGRLLNCWTNILRRLASILLGLKLFCGLASASSKDVNTFKVCKFTFLPPRQTCLFFFYLIHYHG